MFLKDEASQPSGSVKYRWVYARLVEAIRAGTVGPGTTLVEASQGYAGLALAHLGRQLGLSVELHVGPDIAEPIERALSELGATLVRHADPRELPEALAGFARRAQDGSAWHLNQYHRPSLIAGYADLAAEVVGQLEALQERRPRFFLCPVGTGGMIQGVGSRLREHFPDLRVIAIEAAPGEHLGGSVRNTREMHMGELDPYDRSFPDETWYIGGTPKRTRFADLELVPSAALMLELLEERGLRGAFFITPE